MGLENTAGHATTAGYLAKMELYELKWRYPDPSLTCKVKVEALHLKWIAPSNTNEGQGSI